MANEVLFLGGIFNYTDPFFGFQLYLWAFLGMVIMTGIAWLAWRYGQWEPYKPVWGLFYAYKAESQAAFIFNKGLVSELLSERDAKCIFDYSKWQYKLQETEGRFSNLIAWFKGWAFNYATVFLPELPLAKALLYKLGKRNLDVEIAKKMQNNEWEKYSSVTLGGIHTDMILDADNWTIRDSPQHIAIESQCEQWNDANPDDQIHSYSKYSNYIHNDNGNPQKLVAPPEVTPDIVIPWSRIDSAFPIEVGDNEDAGAVRQFAHELDEQDNNSLSKYYLPMIAAGVLIILMIAGMRVIGHFFK